MLNPKPYTLNPKPFLFLVGSLELVSMRTMIAAFQRPQKAWRACRGYRVHIGTSGWTDMVRMEQAASEREASGREALPDSPPAATSVSEKQGRKQEAEGMGAPFGLAL